MEQEKNEATNQKYQQQAQAAVQELFSTTAFLRSEANTRGSGIEQEERTSDSDRGRAATRTSTIGNVVDSQLHTIVGGDGDDSGRFAPASGEGLRFRSDI
jgi:hypothetical protein